MCRILAFSSIILIGTVLTFASVRAELRDDTEYGLLIFQELCISQRLNREAVYGLSIEDGWEKIDEDSPLSALRASESDEAWLVNFDPMMIFAINDVGGCKIIMRRVYKRFVEEFIDLAPANVIHSEAQGPMRIDVFAVKFNDAVGMMMIERFVVGDSMTSISFLSVESMKDQGEAEFARDVLDAAPK